jgi:hypothetical protein
MGLFKVLLLDCRPCCGVLLQKLPRSAQKEANLSGNKHFDPLKILLSMPKKRMGILGVEDNSSMEDTRIPSF